MSALTSRLPPWSQLPLLFVLKHCCARKERKTGGNRLSAVTRAGSLRRQAVPSLPLKLFNPGAPEPHKNIRQQLSGVHLCWH